MNDITLIERMRLVKSYSNLNYAGEDTKMIYDKL